VKRSESTHRKRLTRRVYDALRRKILRVSFAQPPRHRSEKEEIQSAKPLRGGYSEPCAVRSASKMHSKIASRGHYEWTRAHPAQTPLETLLWCNPKKKTSGPRGSTIIASAHFRPDLLETGFDHRVHDEKVEPE